MNIIVHTAIKDAELFIIKMRWVLILGNPLVFLIYNKQSLEKILVITLFALIYNGLVYLITCRRENTKLQLYVYSFFDLLYVSLLYFLSFGKVTDLQQFYYFLILVLGIRFGMRNYYGLVVLIGLIYFFTAQWASRSLSIDPDIIHELIQVLYFIVFGILTSFLLLKERLQQEEREKLIVELQAAYEQLCIYNAQVEEMAITDPLTGLYNYRYFKHRLNQEIEKARRNMRQLSLIILDIDNFKDFNDSFGHPIGDIALKEAAGIFKEKIRDNDVITRYGGEEFLLLLPDTGTDEAYLVAERIRLAMESHTFKTEDRLTDLNITVSGGIATFPLHAKTAEALLKNADDILYNAKNEGRNIICRPMQ